MSDQTDRLLRIMARLRDPRHGCEWDTAQTFETIAPYTIEEAYEVADAIERADMNDLRGELGDLLFQVVFHSQMAEEAGNFTFEDVARAISDKMEARHPHIFGDEGGVMEDNRWEDIKAADAKEKETLTWYKCGSCANVYTCNAKRIECPHPHPEGGTRSMVA